MRKNTFTRDTWVIASEALMSILNVYWMKSLLARHKGISREYVYRLLEGDEISISKAKQICDWMKIALKLESERIELFNKFFSFKENDETMKQLLSNVIKE